MYGSGLNPQRWMAAPLTGRRSNLVCSVAAVLAQPGMPASDSGGTIAGLIGLAAELFSGPIREGGLGRPIWYQRWSEQRPGEGGKWLNLSRWPICHVNSIYRGITSPELVDSDDYEVRGVDCIGSPLGRRDRLYAVDGWEETPYPVYQGHQRASTPFAYDVDYWAGWLMTDEADAWAATTAYVAGDFVQKAVGAASSLYLYECTTAGTSDGSEPTWPSTEAGTVTDGTVVWTARAASVVPVGVQQAAVFQVAAWYRGEGVSIPEGISRERHNQTEVYYTTGEYAQHFYSLSRPVRSLLRSYL